VFKTFGCGSAIASSSYATEVIKGMKVEEALKIKNTDIAKYLKLPPVKLHCSMLAEEAIKKAIEDVKNKNVKRQKDEDKMEAWYSLLWIVLLIWWLIGIIVGNWK